MAMSGLSKGLFAGLEPTLQELLRMRPEQIMASSAPEFLKIAAMQQQGKAREAMTAPTPPTTTVAQDVVQRNVAPPGIGALPTSPAPVASPPALAAAPSAAPARFAQGGVTSLPASPDLYNDRYYADGGIVAFSDGGGTLEERRKRYNEESDARFQRAYQLAREQRYPYVEGPTKYFLDQAGRNIYDIAALPGTFLKGWQYVKDPKTGALIRRSSQEDFSYFPKSREGYESYFGKELPASLAASEAATKEMYPEEEPERRLRTKRLAGRPSMTPAATAPSAGKGGIGDLEITPISSQYLPSMEEIRAGIGSVDITAPQVKYEAFVPESERPREEIIAERRADEVAAGIDREARMGKKRERVGKLEEQFEQESKRAPWLALAQAGLAMAQTPGNFGQAVTAAAQTGLNDYLRAKKDLKADEKELLAMQDALDDAEYAEKMGDVDAVRSARARVEEARARAAEANHKARIDVELWNKGKEFEASALRLQEEGRREQLAVQRAQFAAELAKDYAAIEATMGKARFDYLTKAADAFGKGLMKEEDVIEILRADAERIKKLPEFEREIKNRKSMTREEINAEALEWAARDLSTVRAINYNQQILFGGLPSLPGFSIQRTSP